MRSSSARATHPKLSAWKVHQPDLGEILIAAGNCCVEVQLLRDEEDEADEMQFAPARVVKAGH